MRHAGRIDLDGRAIAYLESLAGDGGNDARLQERSRILLLAASGKTDVEIGEQLGISPKTSWRWRKRYLESGLAGLMTAETAPRKRTISASTVRAILEKTRYERPPRGSTWTSRAMAAVAGVSEASVRRIWREHGIRIAGELEVTAAAASKPEEGTWYPRGIYLYGRERVLVLARMERGALSSAAVEGGHMNVFLRLLLGKTDRLWVDGPRVEFRQFLDRATRTHGDEELIIVVVGTEGARQEALAGISVERAGIRIQELPAHTAWMATLERVLSRLNNANAEGLLVDFVRAIRAYLQDPEEPAMPFVWTWRIETKWPALMTQPLGQSDKLT